MKLLPVLVCWPLGLWVLNQSRNELHVGIVNAGRFRIQFERERSPVAFWILWGVNVAAGGILLVCGAVLALT